MFQEALEEGKVPIIIFFLLLSLLLLLLFLLLLSVSLLLLLLDEGNIGIVFFNGWDLGCDYDKK